MLSSVYDLDLSADVPYEASHLAPVVVEYISTAVGDTISDLQAAFNAGVRWSIGVLSGAHSESQLRSCPHGGIIPSVKDLPSVFK
jgi:phosphoglycolate phosphatase-like HAD superfamily hydrolase